MYICRYGKGKSSTIYQPETAFATDRQGTCRPKRRCGFRRFITTVASSGYDCEAAHCNFHLRGAESDRDEAFVRQLCVKQQVSLHTVHFDTARTAEERHISIEMAARELRYGWFEEIRQKINADAIAVAHHQDDSVETLLLNLIRGTGINGLRGIRPKNGHIVRPLLCLERKEIISYLNRIGQDYVTDSTNLQDEYTRNKIRLNLLPMMQEINPSVKESIPIPPSIWMAHPPYINKG